MKTMIHSNELHDLARTINEREATIGLIRGKVEEGLRLAGPEIILQGQALLKAKASVPYGQWLNWLKANCPLVSKRNAERYMRRAANPTLGDFYRMLCDEEKPEAKADVKQWPVYVEALGRASRFVGYISRFPLDKWPEEGRVKLKQDLEPIAKALWPEHWR